MAFAFRRWLAGVPRGAVKQLRLYTYHFGYQRIAGINHNVGTDGPWEPKRVLGTVGVQPDGSAMFRVPANTPISIQPLDANGRALQLMRSWATAMPGEFLSCVGCHERRTDAVTNRGALAYDTDGRYTADLTPRDDRFDDGRLVTADVGGYQPNAWGLHDMRGNAWEWTRTAYRRYSYKEGDGRNAPGANDRVVVRGGSWRDRPKRCRSAFRLSYPPWRKVFNVGFRVVAAGAPRPLRAQVGAVREEAGFPADLPAAGRFVPMYIGTHQRAFPAGAGAAGFQTSMPEKFAAPPRLATSIEPSAILTIHGPSRRQSPSRPLS